MKTYSLPFGKGEQRISLDETHILYDLHGNHVKAVSDEAAAVRKALRQPIDSLPLVDVVAPGDTVAIIVSDITRPVHTAQMLPVIVNELNLAGIPDGQIKVITAQRDSPGSYAGRRRVGLRQGDGTAPYRYQS